MNGNVSTIAGKDAACAGGATNCGTATTNPLQAIFQQLRKIEIVGNALYTLEYNNHEGDSARAVIRKIDLTANTIAVIAGANAVGAPNDTKPASQARFNCPFDIAAGPSGSLLIADTLNCAVRQIVGDTTMHTIASDPDCSFIDDCPDWDSMDAEFYGSLVPTAVTADAQGNVVAYDQVSHSIIRYSGAASTPILGGVGVYGSLYGVDAAHAAIAPDESAFAAQFATDIIESMQYDTSGNLYMFNFPDFVITKLSASGAVTPVVVDTDDRASGSVSVARLFAAHSIAYAGADLLITDDQLVRLVSDQMTVVDTVMGDEDLEVGEDENGTAGTTAPSGDVARYHEPLASGWGLAVDQAGNRAFVSDVANNQLFVLGIAGDPSTWTFDPYSHSSSEGHVDGPLGSAQFAAPHGLAYDATNKRLYIADTSNDVVRLIDDASSTVSTIAGIAHRAGFSGDNGPAVAAQLRAPSAVVVASDGSLYISDTDNNRVRRLTAAGTITTILGTGDATNVGNATSTAGTVASPRGVRFDTYGNLWVTAGRAVVVITGAPTAPPDGTTAAYVAYQTTPSSDFPSSVVACLSDVDLGPDQTSMLVLDSCLGFVLKLTRQQ